MVQSNLLSLQHRCPHKKDELYYATLPMIFRHCGACPGINPTFPKSNLFKNFLSSHDTFWKYYCSYVPLTYSWVSFVLLIFTIIKVPWIFYLSGLFSIAYFCKCTLILTILFPLHLLPGLACFLNMACFIYINCKVP